MKTFLQVAAFSILALGCASSHVLVGTPRPAISPDQVKLYLHPPAKYEEIALLDASSERSFAITDQGKMNKVIDRLKDEAAKLGANGILLQGTGNETTSSVVTPADGSAIVIPESFKTGKASQFSSFSSSGNEIAKVAAPAAAASSGVLL